MSKLHDEMPTLCLQKWGDYSLLFGWEDGEITVYYLGGPYQSTQILKRGESFFFFLVVLRRKYDNGKA